jgi:hypothetical protein
MSRAAFTVEERDRARDWLLALASADPRVVAGAMVGSMATGPGDRWSDLDLAFGLAPGATPAAILADWTPRIERELKAVQLFDLPYQSAIYRVFLLPGSLQVDVSFTPGAEFGAIGPEFKLLFGSAVERAHLALPAAPYLFGLAVHHAVRARICIERGRMWQAEYWISGVRDQALALACLARGLEPRNARGYDALPETTRARAAAALARSIERDELLRALGVAIESLLAESGAVRETASRVAASLNTLTSAAWSESHNRSTA